MGQAGGSYIPFQQKGPNYCFLLGKTMPALFWRILWSLYSCGTNRDHHIFVQTLTHRIHVWYISLHLPLKRYIYH